MCMGGKLGLNLKDRCNCCKWSTRYHKSIEILRTNYQIFRQIENCTTFACTDFIEKAHWNEELPFFFIHRQNITHIYLQKTFSARQNSKKLRNSHKRKGRVTIICSERHFLKGDTKFHYESKSQNPKVHT